MIEKQKIDLQKLIGLINDTSAKMKIEGLKAIDSIPDWNQYSLTEIKQLFEVIDQNINYPRSDVKLHVEHAHDKLKRIINEIMKTNPVDFASSMADDLVSDEEPASGSSSAQRHQEPAKPVKTHARENMSGAAADIMSEIDGAQETGSAKTAQQPSAKKEEAKPPAQERAKMKPKPQLIVVYANAESRFVKFFLTLVSLVIFSVFLALAYPQIMENTLPGKFAMGATAAYLIFLFCPVSYISSGAKIRVALISLIGMVFYMCFTSGLNVDFGVAEKIKGFKILSDSFNVNDALIKLSFLLVFLSVTIIFLMDEHIGRGYRVFLFMLGAYSMASIFENIVSNAGAKELLLENGGIGQKIPFIYLKPFYLGVNIFLPLAMVTFAFELLADLFEMSFRKLFSTLLSITLAAGACLFFFFNLNELSVINISNIFIPQTVNIDKISSADFYDSVYRSMLQKGDMKEAVLDRLRVEKVEIFAKDETAKENPVPEKILPGPLKNPAISPNGFYLAYVVYDGKKSDIMLYNLKTRGETTALVDDGSFNDFPSFSPTSDRIAYISNKSGADNIYAVKINKTETKQITNTATQKSHLVWAPQRNSVTYIEGGSLIKQPVELDTTGDKKEPREKLKLFSSVAEKIVSGAKINAEISTLTPNQITIKYKTSKKNLSEMFQEISAVLITAAKIFEDSESIEKFVVSVNYFNDKIEITTIPAIVKQNIDDLKFINAEKIKIWLKNSTVYINDKIKVFE